MIEPIIDTGGLLHQLSAVQFEFLVAFTFLALCSGLRFGRFFAAGTAMVLLMDYFLKVGVLA